MENKLFLMTIVMMIVTLCSVAQKTGTFTDSRDGKIYKIVTINTQTWMAENLAFKTKMGCWAYEDKESNVAKYGYLYDWETAKTACSQGWHLPSDAEWIKLTTYFGGQSIAGGKLKEKGTTNWHNPNKDATNESGFTALPGGIRYDFGTYSDMGDYGNWWSSTEYITHTEKTSNGGSCIIMYYSTSTAKKDFDNKKSGYSVRCIRNK